MFPTWHRPQHGEVVTIADGGRVRKTGSPQAGPVPGHLDDGGAPHASYCSDLPPFHGHGAGDEDPAQNRHQETPDLDYANPHLWRCEFDPVVFQRSFKSLLYVQIHTDVKVASAPRDEEEESNQRTCGCESQH